MLHLVRAHLVLSPMKQVLAMSEEQKQRTAARAGRYKHAWDQSCVKEDTNKAGLYV